MHDQNPYQAPETADLEVTENSAAIYKVAWGQKLIVYAILLNIASFPVAQFLPLVGVLVNLIALGVAIVGIVRLASGLGFSTFSRVIFILLMILPLANLLVLVALSSRATKRLRQAGYQVGLLGAKL